MDNRTQASGLAELATIVTTDICGITRGRSFFASELDTRKNRVGGPGDAMMAG